MALVPNPYQGRCNLCGTYLFAKKGFWDGTRTLCQEHAGPEPAPLADPRVQICLEDGRALPLPVSHLGREGFQRFASACAGVGVHFRSGKRSAALDVVPRLIQSLKRSGFVPEVMPELSTALFERAVEVRQLVDHASLRADRADRQLRDRGKSLYEYQFKGVDRLVQSRSLVLGDAPGLGKGGTLSTKILTPTGWTTFGRVKVGDRVIGSDGKSHRVTGVFPRGRLPVYTVKFSDGAMTRCDGEHLWPVSEKGQAPCLGMSDEDLRLLEREALAGDPGARERLVRFAPRTLLDLIESGLQDEDREDRYRIPLVEPVEFDAKPLRFDPWLVGWAVANGLEWHPAYHELPDCLHNSVDVRRSLLSAIIGPKDRGWVAVKSRAIADAVRFLAMSLGGTATTSYEYFDNHGRPDHVVTFRLPGEHEAPTRSLSYAYQHGVEEVVCIAVDAPDRLYVTDDFIVTHNTIQTLVSAPPEGRVLVIAPAIMKGAIIDGAPRGGWAAATRVWRPEFKITILSGRGSFRWPEEGEVVITNYDILPPTPDQLAQMLEKKRRAAKKAGEAFDPEAAVAEIIASYGAPVEAPDGQVTVAADEAHLCTKETSQRTQRYKRVSMLARESGGSSWALTGTPLMNTPEELWCLLDCLGIATSTFGSWANYMRLYEATRVQVAERRWEILWGKPTPEVAERLRTAMLRREKRDVLKDLPERQSQTLVVPIDKTALKLCDEALKTLEDAGINLAEAIELAEKAKDKIAFPLMSKVREALARAKAPSMIELAEQYESAQTPVIFFSCHLVIPTLMERRKGWGTIVGDGGTICMDGANVQKVAKSEVVLRLINGDIDNVAGTIGAMGTGVDGLQERISHGVFVDEAWTPGANEQAISRLERIGATSKIMITRVIGDHALDYRVAEVIDKKERLFEQTITAAADRPHNPAPEFDLAAELERAAALVPPPWGGVKPGRNRR